MKSKMLKSKMLVACVAAAALLQAVSTEAGTVRKNARLTGSLRADYSTKAQAVRSGNDITIRCDYHVRVKMKILGRWVHVASRSGTVSATVPDNSHQKVYARDLGHGVSVEVWVTAGGGDVTVTYIVNSPRGVYEDRDSLRP